MHPLIDNMTDKVSRHLSNVTPWITTVGTGTLDRDFLAYVALKNGFNFSGVSLYHGNALPNSHLPLVYAGNVSNSAMNGDLCMIGIKLLGRSCCVTGI